MNVREVNIINSVEMRSKNMETKSIGQGYAAKALELYDLAIDFSPHTDEERAKARNNFIGALNNALADSLNLGYANALQAVSGHIQAMQSESL